MKREGVNETVLLLLSMTYQKLISLRTSWREASCGVVTTTAPSLARRETRDRCSSDVPSTDTTHITCPDPIHRDSHIHTHPYTYIQMPIQTPYIEIHTSLHIHMYKQTPYRFIETDIIIFMHAYTYI